MDFPIITSTYIASAGYYAPMLAPQGPVVSKNSAIRLSWPVQHLSVKHTSRTYSYAPRKSENYIILPKALENERKWVIYKGKVQAYLDWALTQERTVAKIIFFQKYFFLGVFFRPMYSDLRYRTEIEMSNRDTENTNFSLHAPLALPSLLTRV